MRMSRHTLGIVAFWFLWVGLLAFAMYELYGTVPEEVGDKPIAHMENSGTDPGSVGAERHAILVRATHLYVVTHPDAPAAMSAGKELAPESFLNGELRREGRKWRVRRVHGMGAQIYDVS